MPLARVTVTLPPDLVAAADELARRRGTSRSSVVADAMGSHLDAVTQAERTGRVAEPAGSVYAISVSDEALLAELGRRLQWRVPGALVTAPPAHEGPRLRFDADRLAAVCRRHHVSKLSLFGSVLTDAFGPDSDVDVLVEFEAGHTPGLAITDVEDELSAVFGGHRVDVVTERSLHRLIRERVLASSVVQVGA